MSPRASSSTPRSVSSASAPYTRRAAGQPKSSRQQFSACGACRMRRVRCDLKDLPLTTTTAGLQQPACSNCKERGIKCVDEFAEVKAVKLLRRGRRLQQVEAVYGKVADDESVGPSSGIAAASTHPAIASNLPASIAPLRQSVIPHLRLEFLSSSFFRRFSVQRPIIEPTEFTARYFAHVKGTAPLSIEGQMIAMLLVTWAASFGVNEYGNVEDSEPTSPSSHSGPGFSGDEEEELSEARRRTRAMRTEAMTREILGLIDTHGLLRRPTWDGVRVLLLVLPLTQEIQTSMDRLTTYEATLSQIYTLCSLASPTSVNSGQGPYCDALVRARVFWYAHVHEGTTTGLRGGRLLLDDDDLLAFQTTLPPQYCSSASGSSPSSGSPSSHASPTPNSPVLSDFPISLQDPRGHSRASLAYLVTTHYFSLALAVSRVCRAVHAVLTGPRARLRADAGVAIREDSLVEIWEGLERCWDDFEALRRGAVGVGTVGGGVIRGEDVERFVSGWQVFIFECHNVIREALKQRIVAQSPHASPAMHARSSLPANPSSDYGAVLRMHAQATQRCRTALPRVLSILKRHLAVPSSGFFSNDAGLVRDGCFYAAMLLAQGGLEEDADLDIKCEDGQSWDADVEDGVDICVRALGEMDWVYAKSNEREKTVRMAWDDRINRESERRREQGRRREYVEDQRQGEALHHASRSQEHHGYMVTKPQLSAPYHRQQTQSHPLSLISAAGQARPQLPPLSVASSHIESAPNTSATDDGSSSWTTYTPPTTSGSMASTAATHRSSPSSSDSSPPHTSLNSLPSAPRPVKHDADAFYSDVSEVDQFSFSVDGVTVSTGLTGPGLGTQTWSPPYTHQVGPGSGYLDPSVIFTHDTLAAASGVGNDDNCPHFGSECQGFFH
ncbi:hypothetical protein BV22DRAFT_1002173 [Leucogyrophana mollusca]|uniref:Uncharacterized protein n=1 Tax=Leucogyrophana mollusca TaxID=85980 RepID=A0ACB8BX09_9AGAM|nr:hypothetical protein BV22DRAFT_1002173 [Leucogyrophana mollusca]